MSGDYLLETCHIKLTQLYFITPHYSCVHENLKLMYSFVHMHAQILLYEKEIMQYSVYILTSLA